MGEAVIVSRICIAGEPQLDLAYTCKQDHFHPNACHPPTSDMFSVVCLLLLAAVICCTKSFEWRVRAGEACLKCSREKGKWAAGVDDVTRRFFLVTDTDYV